jgi:hypothetical protein
MESSPDALERAAKKLARQRRAMAGVQFSASIRPIYAVYGKGPNPTLEQTASCVLLEIDGHRILSTAAHVLDHYSHGATLFVAGVGVRTLTPMVGGIFKTTTAPNDDRDLDRLDCGFWVIPDSAIGSMGNVQFVNASRFSENTQPLGEHQYKAMGYRNSRNKRAVNNARKTVELRASGYVGSLTHIPELNEELGFLGFRHLCLQFGEDAEDEDGNHANTFGPKGFSGGALLDLGRFEPPYESCDSTWRALLSGMLIEHNKKHKALIAVKIGNIADGIRRIVPLKHPPEP